MAIKVEPFAPDPTKTAIYFVEEKFRLLYPAQRYHYISHLIPREFYEQYLTDTVWFEMAPGEKPEELEYPDEEMVSEITPNVMAILQRADFFKSLDDIFWPTGFYKKKGVCYGDFRTSKEVLLKCGFKQEEYSDIFHVLMMQGGFCDCEILFNVAEESRLKAQYWKARAKNLKPHDPHERA